MKAFRRAVNRLEAESARTLEAFDRTNAYEVDGLLSAASWLRHRGEIIERLIFPDELEATRHPSVVFGGQAQAATHLLGAMALVQFAAFSASHVLVDRSPDRRVGKESLRLLVDRIRHGLFGCCHGSQHSEEEMLVEAARQLAPRMFRQVTVDLRQCLDPDGALREANDAHERRAVWLSETMDGVFLLNGTLDAEGGAILRTALAAVEGRPVAGDKRGAPQRRGDAMVDLARHRLDVGDLPTTGCQRPHLTVTADLEVLAGKPAGAGLLSWEQLVPAETVRRLA
jgi:hypothetical protein